MSSSSSAGRRVRPLVLRDPATTQAPAVLALDLAPSGLARLDPTRIDDAVAEGRAAGYQAGYAAGEAAGFAAIEAAQADVVAARRDQLTAVLLAAEEAVADGLSGLSAVADAAARVTTAAAFAIVEALVGRELALATDPGRDAVARALSLAPEGVELTLRLNPADAAALAVDERPPGRGVTVVADAGVAVGDCIADAGWTQVDARIGTALERVRAVLEGAS